MPNKPAPQEVIVDPKTTAFLVLDLNCRCEDPQEATAAVRPFGYTCVIPIDGLVARGAYEHDFTLHQFTLLPGGDEKSLYVVR